MSALARARSKNAPAQSEHHALAFPQVSLQRGVIGDDFAGKLERAGLDDLGQEGVGEVVAPSRGAQGIGDGVAGTRDVVCGLQRIAPPLQADLADGRLAGGDIGHAGNLAGECRHGQQAGAGRRRREQGRKVAVGLAGARGSDNGVGIGSRGRAARTIGHVSRGAPPPPWRASPARRGPD